MQPPRFLVINISGASTCQSLYETIKERVLGKVQDYQITPNQLADVIKYGLCGPSVIDSRALKKPLPPTSNACRITIKSQIVPVEKRNDFAILIIDEFVPTDFHWDRDYSLQERKERMGDAFDFFISLTGEAYTGEWVCSFCGNQVRGLCSCNS